MTQDFYTMYAAAEIFWEMQTNGMIVDILVPPVAGPSAACH